MSRAKFVQLQLFAEHRHCVKCGVVTQLRASICGECAPQTAHPCAICNAVPDAPCTAWDGGALPQVHADRGRS